MSKEIRSEGLQPSVLGIKDTTKALLRQGVNPLNSLRDRFQQVLNFPFSTSRRRFLTAGAAILAAVPTIVRAQEAPNPEEGVVGLQDETPVEIFPGVEVLEEHAFDSNIDALDVAAVPGEVIDTNQTSPEQPVEQLTPHQRVVNNLREFYKSLRNLSQFTPYNPAEIEAAANNPDQRVFTTFRFLWDRNDTPVGFLLTGGKSGLRSDLGNIKSIEEAIKLIDRIDPEMIPLLTSRGFKGISGMYFTMVMPEAFATFDPRRGMVLINEPGHPRDHPLPGAMMAVLLAEARINYTLQNSVVKDGRTMLLGADKLDDNPGLDKSKWAKIWAQQHQDLFDKNAYSSFMAVVNWSLEYYSTRWF